MNEENLIQAVQEFVGAFEVVFRYDWEYTKCMIGGEREGCDFIEPGLDDKTEDWGARGALLEKYRALVTVMKRKGLEPHFPFPLNRVSSKPRIW